MTTVANTNEELAVQNGAVIPVANSAAVVVPKKSYALALLTAVKDEFIAVNEGLDMDFVYLATWLTIDKKGVFIEKDGKDDPKTRVAYGDVIDVVIAQGEKRWTLWGEKDSPEEGQLITAENKQEDAQEKLAMWLEENPEAKDRYDMDSPQLCYLAYVIPVSTLGGEDFPKIYLMSFPKTATIAYGKYSYNGIFQGKYKALGIPTRTGVGSVVTRIGTVDAKGKGNDSYLALTFEPVGMFRPEEYGVNPNGDMDAQQAE